MRGYFARLNGLLLLIFLVLLAGCSARAQRQAGLNSDELTREQLSRYNTVGEAVQALRSGWLNRRTPLRLSPTGTTTEANPVWVYRDGTRVGGPDVLRNLSTVEVAEVQFIDAARASNRWGINHENGVIHVISR